MNDIDKFKQQVFDFLALRNVAFVCAEYSGGGDSGQIDDVALFDANKKAMEVEFGPQDNVAAVVLGERSFDNVQTMLQEFTYEMLDQLSVTDWSNNDGGGGTFYICVNGPCTTSRDEEEMKPRAIRVEHYFNETTSTSEVYEA